MNPHAARPRVRFYVRIAYYDEPADISSFDDEAEAAEAFQCAIDNFSTAGRQMGDISRISYGSRNADGTLNRYVARDFN